MPGASYGQINVSGGALIDGTLNVVTPGPFVPSPPQTFQVLRYGAHAGTFATVNGTDLGGGLFYEVQYNATNVALVTRATVPPPLFATAPLIAAKDAILLDTTTLDAEAAFRAALAIVIGCAGMQAS